MKLKKDKNNYSPEYVRKNRTFPTRNTVILIILIILQVFLAFIACIVEFKPQDIIKNYEITVEPKDNGTLDITYDFVWQAIDTSEPLTWVEIGMANMHYTVYDSSVSSNIANYEHYIDGDYTSLELYFDRAYNGGETLEFSFKINLQNMLCKSTAEYYYEFIPGWFNSTPVENYEFRWKQNEYCNSAVNAKDYNGYYIWSGSLDCGEYARMFVRYNEDAFTGADTVTYESFDDSGAYNELNESRFATIALLILVIGVLLLAELFIVDSYVSYNRGRGFLTGYGYRVHTYGRINPKFENAYVEHLGSSSRGTSGGCACACACACAGGGRAGCSQKDTYTNK